MKDYLKKILPQNAINKLKYIINEITLPAGYLYDYIRYRKENGSNKTLKNKEKLKFLIIKDTHRIEKGMALPEPKLGFGKDVISRLMKNIESYKNHHGSSYAIDQAYSTLREYGIKNLQHIENEETKFFIEKKIDNKIKKQGGTINLEREDVFNEKWPKEFDNFFSRRYSLRQFSEQKVDEEKILKSIKISQKTPSVCNRQSYKTYVVRDKSKIEKSLILQNGNKGFGDKCSHLLVICSDLNSFEGTTERNQAYFDSGLYAMSLVLSLHSHGIGTCFLNWSAKIDKDKKIRSELGIPNNEVVTTLIAIGSIPEKFTVAESPRAPIEEKYKFI